MASIDKMVEEKKVISSIQISDKLKAKLRSLGKMGQTYEDVIWELIENKK